MTSALVDANALTGASAGSGVGTYTRSLLAALAGIPDLEVLALATRDAPLPSGVIRHTVGRHHLRPRAEVIEHNVRLPFELLRAPGDVFHNPGFHAPWGVRRPWVQTLLDVIPLVIDDPDVASLAKRWRRFGPRYAKADAVIAISRHAADEGIRLLNLDPAKVHVAPLGVSPTYQPGPDPPAEPPYLLVVSEFSKRKGFPEAFAVIGALADAGYPHRLKVAGRVHDWQEKAFARVLADAPRPDKVDVLGFVDDLPALYRGATVFLMTSRYEGFGLPALEAMASGTPVVAFANSATAEVVDHGGILVDDGSVEAMTAAVRSLLDSPARREELRAAGLRRAATFTWEASARIHADVFRSVAGA